MQLFFNHQRQLQLPMASAMAKFATMMQNQRDTENRTIQFEDNWKRQIFQDGTALWKEREAEQKLKEEESK